MLHLFRLLLRLQLSFFKFFMLVKTFHLFGDQYNYYRRVKLWITGIY